MAMAREWDDEMSSDELAELVPWYRMTTREGRTLDWQIVGTRNAIGRRLLIVELDAEAEGRVMEAIGVLTGRPLD